MISKYLRIVMVGICGVLLVSGCASTPRGLKHEGTRPSKVVEEAQSAVEQNLSIAVSRLGLGATEVVQETPIGVATVTVIGEYLNGLGETCKRVQIQNEGNILKGAVCLGDDHIWRFVHHF